ncbi:hypothetical protein RHMOL_Rhmol03G0113100 [Rhododendron molle]|uniref:Uncharacterized protein n=1 Tax=Rhododendron molle TaxID=49168 RepID=A0ACC0PEI2_RHOML|nr:hypothetical protein RHMOL_Rhmol03G0113100 [Rhododendron molle]
MAGETLVTVTNGSLNIVPDPQRTYQIVVAATRNMGIGKDGKLPWKLPSDMKFFKEVTLTTSDPAKKNAVIMGRKTWESIPLEYRPLPGRLNVVLTRSGSFDIATAENVVLCGSITSSLELLAASPYCLSIEKVFVVGGGQILREALNAPGCDAIHMTEIESSIECDTFIPAVDTSVFFPWYSSFPSVENNIRYSFTTYVRVKNSTAESLSQTNGKISDNCSDSAKFGVKNFSFLPKMIFEKHEEYLYLRLVEDSLMALLKMTEQGPELYRNLVARFGNCINFPLLSLLRVFIKKILGTILFGFLVIWTDAIQSAEIFPDSHDKGIKYFGEVLLRNFFGSSVVQQMLRSFRRRAFTYGMAMHQETPLIGNIRLADREEGDLGPVYGFQWRHFGARYTNMHADYTGLGFDQLLDAIDKIKNKPDDRRIILSAWNPSYLKLMALPPCHMFAQFYVANGELSCQMCQHSADMDLVPGDFVHVIGDAHVYLNHIRPLQEQLKKLPKPFPAQLPELMLTEYSGIYPSIVYVRTWSPLVPHRDVGSKVQLSRANTVLEGGREPNDLLVSTARPQLIDEADLCG